MRQNTYVPEREPRQAVVIIHGIGEQIPMQTLRGFVEFVSGYAFDRRAESKPDHLSPTLELHRMAVPNDQKWEEGDWVSTDFYELYWAHLMTGTAWRHVSAWVATLLLPPWRWVPARLVTAFVVSWFIVIAVTAAVFLLLAPISNMSHTWSPLVAAIVGAFIWLCRATGTHFGLKYAGDAARYLSPSPENVGVRQTIRSAAIELLEKLHDDPTWRRYHRIIVVGHSLGSVIAYDALAHLWQRRHHSPARYPMPGDPSDEKHQERLYKDNLRVVDGRVRQSAIWRAQRRQGVRWKITDFVTLGSPLAHARFLMAKDLTDFENRKCQREYPTCPPQPNDERDRQYGKSLLTTSVGGTLLHHAAQFACTRWTNIYFDGDIIGGPIKGLGEWIDNQSCGSRCLPHTKYWKPGTDCIKLLQALDLCDWWKDKANTSTAIDAHHRDSAESSSGL